MEAKNLSEYEVEDFILLIRRDKMNKGVLIKTIEDQNLKSDILEKILQRVNFAYARISKPLDFDQRILFILFPFGIINRLYDNDFFDVQKNIELGFVKKVNEFYWCSFLGIFLYSIITIIIVNFF